MMAVTALANWCNLFNVLGRSLCVGREPEASVIHQHKTVVTEQ